MAHWDADGEGGGGSGGPVTLAQLPVGNDGESLMTISGAAASVCAYDRGAQAQLGKMGGTWSNMRPVEAALGANGAGLATGVMTLVPVYLPKGVSIGYVAFCVGSTAVSALTHFFCALYDDTGTNGQPGTLLRQSTDNTGKAMPANTWVEQALSSAFTTTYEGIHWVAIMVAATTAPSTRGIAASAQAVGLPSGFTGMTPVTACGSNGSGLTATAPAGPLTLTYQSIAPWVIIHT